MSVGVTAVVAIALLIVLSAAYVGNASAETTYGGHGPWTIVVGQDGNGYLLNTTTGAAWRLEHSLKTPLQERTLQPGN
jgi:hypothetical protein